ncbi:MAG: hypothetical protein UW71_C0024G0007 [Parcubacteria group bacterium GW2011_GWB1_44_7]|uniref:Uncharacterized protein n=1 Tax=Candidatus Giovannonibacteria bacterium GW2011_GWA2_45_21 TaxID=1618649 RepID=A0A0G1M7L8_9BACT|nr:MAG: hypothetical protein UW71_C0024G0007 [Parcubacteria group bacterium GW2011_GWB1_44_7]KKU04294.1 MAG: hypothetical protein UX06_C0023G0009 [Candidatus Giovannonibacteria bacterium GW2011_GWA2_45_21]
MSLEQLKSGPVLEEALEKAGREASEREELAKKEAGGVEKKEFDPEAERREIYARHEERMKKLMQFRGEMFKKVEEAIEAERRKSPLSEGHGYTSTAGYKAFSDAHGRALDKINFGQKEDDEVQLASDEKAALLYQRKYNEIQRDMKLEIAALDERVKASKPEKPEKSKKSEESKVEELKPEDLEKIMSEI